MIDTCNNCRDFLNWRKDLEIKLQAADALAKAAGDLRGVEIGTSHWWAVEKNFHEALAAYEKVRG